MAIETAARPDQPSGKRDVMLLAAAAAIVLIAAAALIAWLVSSGPLPSPPVTVSITPTPPDKTPPPAMPEPVAAVPAGPTPFPDPALIENVQYGPLPIVSRDARMARQVYAQPFDAADKRPRIGILIDDLGSSVSLTHDAIHALPPAVSLSFMPFRRSLPELTAEAHAAGHEILLDLPMEPADLRHHDPGPNALLTALDTPANLGRLEWMMGRATGYVGMSAFLGGRFASDRADLEPMLIEINRRGLLYVDNHAAPQSVAPLIAGEISLPIATVSVQLDTDPSRNAIDQRLAELEQDAARDGQAVGIAAASDSVLQRVGAWAETLGDRKLVLAPISAFVTSPKPPPPPEAPKPSTPVGK